MFLKISIDYRFKSLAISANWARAACLLRLGYGAPGEIFDDFGGDDVGVQRWLHAECGCNFTAGGTEISNGLGKPGRLDNPARLALSSRLSSLSRKMSRLSLLC